MKQAIIIALVFFYIPARAQEEVQNRNSAKSHKLEISYNTGYNFGNTLHGNVYEPRAYKWKIKDNIFHKINLGCYIGKRVEVGIGYNLYQWEGHVEYLTSKYYPKDATCMALSVYAFSNYYFPVRGGVFYGGAIVGAAKSFVKGTQYPIGHYGGSDYNNFYSGHGWEYNAHIGYKFPLVKNRLWFNVEGGVTETKINKIDLPYFHRSDYSYRMDSYSALAGLMFRM